MDGGEKHESSDASFAGKKNIRKAFSAENFSSVSQKKSKQLLFYKF